MLVQMIRHCVEAVPRYDGCVSHCVCYSCWLWAIGSWVTEPSADCCLCCLRSGLVAVLHTLPTFKQRPILIREFKSTLLVYNAGCGITTNCSGTAKKVKGSSYTAYRTDQSDSCWQICSFKQHLDFSGKHSAMLEDFVHIQPPLSIARYPPGTH